MTNSPHFEDFHPVTTKEAPPSYGGDLSGRGRWFEYYEDDRLAGTVWTDDGLNLGVMGRAETDWELMQRVQAAIREQYAKGTSATELFNRLVLQANPDVWAEGPLDVLL